MTLQISLECVGVYGWWLSPEPPFKAERDPLGHRVKPEKEQRGVAADGQQATAVRFSRAWLGGS